MRDSSAIEILGAHQGNPLANGRFELFVTSMDSVDANVT
jgi:hypothetical protein